jgi:hypothetical protein
MTYEQIIKLKVGDLIRWENEYSWTLDLVIEVNPNEATTKIINKENFKHDFGFEESYPLQELESDSWTLIAN